MKELENHQYLYQQIYSTLKKEILDKKYSTGDHFPPERVLKDRFNTTHLTIRKALTRLVSEGLIKRYSGRGTIVTYSKDKYYSAAPKVPLRTLHFIVPEIDDFTANVMNRVETRMRRIGVTTSYCCHRNDRSVERELYTRAGEDEDALIIFFPSSSDLTWLDFNPSLFKTIAIQGYFVGVKIPQLLIDHFSGAYQAVKYLCTVGHEKIAHVSSEFEVAGSHKKAGYLKAMEDNGARPQDSIIVAGGASVEGGRTACRRILREHPECRGFFCAEDYSALGVIRGLEQEGLHPGKDVSVVGYGNTVLSEPLELTTIEPNTGKLTDQLLLLIEDYSFSGSLGSESYMIPTELKIRRSCIR